MLLILLCLAVSSTDATGHTAFAAFCVQNPHHTICSSSADQFTATLDLDERELVESASSTAASVRAIEAILLARSDSDDYRELLMSIFLHVFYDARSEYDPETVTGRFRASVELDSPPFTLCGFLLLFPERFRGVAEEWARQAIGAHPDRVHELISSMVELIHDRLSIAPVVISPPPPPPQPVVTGRVASRRRVEPEEQTFNYLWNTEVSHYETSSDESADDCAVCLDALLTTCGRTPCGHRFHVLCLERVISETKRSCPMCRSALPPMERSVRWGMVCAGEALKAALQYPSIVAVLQQEARPTYPRGPVNLMGGMTRMLSSALGCVSVPLLHRQARLRLLEAIRNFQVDPLSEDSVVRIEHLAGVLDICDVQEWVRGIERVLSV